MCLCEQNGTLKIIDRKKHIFKLAQGEYIAPEKIENVYVRSDAVAQVFVHGESLQVGGVCCVNQDLSMTATMKQSPDYTSSLSTISAVFTLYVYYVHLQACLIAVVVPDHDFLSGWTKRTMGLEGSYEELCSRAVRLRFNYSIYCIQSTCMRFPVPSTNPVSNDDNRVNYLSLWNPKSCRLCLSKN